MPALITGATGFVGSAVLRLLIEEGYETRALVRPHSDRRNLAGLPVELVEGDLTDESSLARAVRGCDVLFHVAADYRLWIPDPDSIYKVNVEGTRNLIQAAVNAEIEKIVYTSSVATLGLNRDGSPANENTPVSLADMIGHYKRSKFLAEETVRELVRTIHAPVTIVNPSTPVGPGDIKPTPTGRIFVNALSNRMPAYVDTGLNIVHVEDVARGHLLALQYGKPGERYIIGGENMTLKNILTEICRIANLREPVIRLPHNAVVPVAWFCEGWAKLTGIKPFVSIDEIRMAKKCMYFSIDKAQKNLGYQPRPAVEAIHAAVTWFRENGYC